MREYPRRKAKELPWIHILPRPGNLSQGQLIAGGRLMRCALGRSGIGHKRREGDGITPRGRFALLHAMMRMDQIPIRTSRLPHCAIGQYDGWCDAAGDRNYNRPVPMPYPASCESLWRDDHLYDVAVVMDHNITRHMGVGGSAIFFHLAHEDYRPTEGCVAISRADMLWLLPRIGPGTLMVIR